MSQMVLPQNLQKGSSSEAAGASSSPASGTEKSGSSRFDDVSRTEQQRLEARRADQNRVDNNRADNNRADKNRAADDQARQNAEASKSDAKKADRSGKPDKTEQASDADATQPAAKPTGDEAAESVVADQLVAAGQSDQVAADPLLTSGGESEAPAAEENAAETVTVTFAGLQSLVTPAQPAQTATTGAAVPANGQGASIMQGSLMPGIGAGGTGKSGALLAESSGQKGLTSGLALAENLLAGAGSEGSRQASDSPILQNAIRFQGALESLNGQPNSVNVPKMAPDASVLRGYTTSIDVPVSHAEWGDKVAGKLTWLTARNMSVAEIHLTPPDMGPMEVRVQVQQDQANITVHSANPVVRDQLELHSYRLRDMLSEQGLSLEQFDVSDSGQDQAADGDSGSSGEAGKTGDGLMAGSDADNAPAESRSLDLTWKGEVDIFA